MKINRLDDIQKRELNSLEITSIEIGMLKMLNRNLYLHSSIYNLLHCSICYVLLFLNGL